MVMLLARTVPDAPMPIQTITEHLTGKATVRLAPWIHLDWATFSVD